MSYRKYDVTFTYATPLMDKSQTFKGISVEMFYRLRKRFFENYGAHLLAIEVVSHDTQRRCPAFCWCADDGDGEYTDPIKFYERYGW